MTTALTNFWAIAQRVGHLSDCANTDGTAVQTGSCRCSTDACAKDQLCKKASAAGERCTTAQACAVTDGSASTSVPCKCGTAVCAQGKFCDSTSNACSSTAATLSAAATKAGEDAKAKATQDWDAEKAKFANKTQAQADLKTKLASVTLAGVNLSSAAVVVDDSNAEPIVSVSGITFTSTPTAADGEALLTAMKMDKDIWTATFSAARRLEGRRLNSYTMTATMKSKTAYAQEKQAAAISAQHKKDVAAAANNANTPPVVKPVTGSFAAGATFAAAAFTLLAAF
jgi:hypothetical protein